MLWSSETINLGLFRANKQFWANFCLFLGSLVPVAAATSGYNFEVIEVP